MEITAAAGRVTEYFPINLRVAREALGISQAELAARVTTLGHPFTQATVWKLEQGHREPKLSETVAIAQALDLFSWTQLITEPVAFDAAMKIERWLIRMNDLAERTRAAAAAQLDALLELAVAVRAAQDAGLSVGWAARAMAWLEMTPEVTVLREVLAARVAAEDEQETSDRRFDELNRLGEQILTALESSGLPLVVKPEDIVFVPAKTGDLDEDDEDRTEPA